MNRFEVEHDDGEGDAPIADLDRVITVTAFIMQARIVHDRAAKLRKLESAIAVAEKKLARVTAQADRKLEETDIEVARRLKAADDQIAEDRAHREHVAEQEQFQERYHEVRARHPNWPQQKILEALATGEPARRSSGTFKNVREGFGSDPFAPSTLTRSVPA